jgi:hypothetical protein
VDRKPPEDLPLDRIIRDAVDAYIAQLKTAVDPQLSTDLVSRVRPAVFRVLEKFAVLHQKLLDADSPKKLRALSKELNIDSGKMREVLADYIRLAILHLRQAKALTVAEQCRRRAFAISQRETARDLNELRAEMGNPANWPLLATRDRTRDSVDQVDALLLKKDREATYSALLSAVKQYALWTAKHVWGLLKTHAAEIGIAVVLLGSIVSLALGQIGSTWPAIGICVGLAWGLIRHYWLNSRLGDLFFEWRKRRLDTSIHDFYDSAIWTYVFLALLAIKFDRSVKKSDPSESTD